MSNMHPMVVWLRPNETESKLGKLNGFRFGQMLYFLHFILEIIRLNRRLDQSSYLLANLDASGFYRVNYDDSNWQKITDQLIHNKDVRFFTASCEHLSSSREMSKQIRAFSSQFRSK